VQKTDSALQAKMDRVLHTEELLEHILLQLQITDLLVNVPRVCKEWQRTVKDSPHLQERLFYRPLSCKLLRLVKRGRVHTFAEDEDDSDTYHVLYNLFCDTLRWNISFDGPHSQRWQIIMRPEASWRHMLATQPPTRTHYNYSSGLSTMVDMRGGGLRLDDLVHMGVRGRPWMDLVPGSEKCEEVDDPCRVRHLVY